MSSSIHAFQPVAFHRPTTTTSALFNEKPDWQKAAELGWSMGGEDYTRDVKPMEHEDPRKSIKQGESFEEYMKSRGQ
jgi:hypothetical protein